jgi:hypothetical protein
LPVGDDGVVAERPTIDPVMQIQRIVQVPPAPAGPVEEEVGGDVLVFNGVNGATGDYLLPPMTAGQVAAVARGQPLAADATEKLRRQYRSITDLTF